jgi:phosphoglycolate phosphatase-like HAD superfamily hydrolase
MTAPSSPRTGEVRGVVFDLDGTLVDGYEGITTGVNAARAAEGRTGVEETTLGDLIERLGGDASERAADATREPADDFFCHRYNVWYPSFDCAIRTRFRTSPGCLRCDQGRFNLKRHASAIRGVRWRLAASD